MAIYQANDKYRATLRTVFIDGTDTTIKVTAIPANLPTLVTLGWNTATQVVYAVTGTSGTTSADFALTGITKIKGYTGNQAEGVAVNCLNHEEFFNQYSGVINDDTIRLNNGSVDPSTPASGKSLFYIKNSAPYTINSSGTITQIGFKSDQWIDVADASTMTFDLSETVKRLKFRAGALTANRTFAITNFTEGMVFMIRVMQDSTGSRTVTWFPVVSDTVTMTIAAPCVVTTTKDIRTGTPVIFTTTGALPTGITSGTKYYWIRTGATTGNVATSKANALAGTTITTTGSQSGTHTMKTQIVWAQDTVPTLTTGKNQYDDFGFVVHDANTITGVVIAQAL